MVQPITAYYFPLNTFLTQYNMELIDKSDSSFINLKNKIYSYIITVMVRMVTVVIRVILIVVDYYFVL